MTIEIPSGTQIGPACGMGDSDMASVSLSYAYVLLREYVRYRVGSTTLFEETDPEFLDDMRCVRSADDFHACGVESIEKLIEQLGEEELLEWQQHFSNVLSMPAAQCGWLNPETCAIDWSAYQCYCTNLATIPSDATRELPDPSRYSAGDLGACREPPDPFTEKLEQIVRPPWSRSEESKGISPWVYVGLAGLGLAAALAVGFSGGRGR